MQRTTPKRVSPLFVLLLFIAVCAIGAFGYSFFAPPTPEDEASHQLGGLAVSVLAKPTSIEAFELCLPERGCIPDPSDKSVFKDTETRAYTVSKHIAVVTPDAYRHLQRVLYTDANYNTEGELEFYPKVAFRVHGQDTQFVDVLVDINNTKVRIIPCADSTDNEDGTWISMTMTLDDLKAAVVSTFPDLK